jgi:hypothetical protein
VAWAEQICWSVVCDVCGDGWRGEAPHFASREDGEVSAKADGWAVAGERIVCPECLHVQECALTGHDWGGWTAAGPFPRRAGGTWHGRVRHCRVCSAADWDPPVHGVVAGAAQERASTADARLSVTSRPNPGQEG